MDHLSSQGVPQDNLPIPANQALALQHKISALAHETQQLEFQQLQLRSQLSGYEKQLQEAQASQRENLERLALKRSQELQGQLADLEQRLRGLRAQKDELAKQQDSLSLLQAVRAREADLAAFRVQERVILAEREPPLSPPPPRRSRRRWWLAGLGVLAVIVVLVVVLPRLLPRSAPQVTAPTTQDCVENLFAPCYTPAQIQNAFRLTPLYHRGYDGRGQTIVVVGSGNPRTLQSDLHAFDMALGLPDPPSFQILYGPVNK